MHSSATPHSTCPDTSRHCATCVMNFPALPPQCQPVVVNSPHLMNFALTLLIGTPPPLHPPPQSQLAKPAACHLQLTNSLADCLALFLPGPHTELHVADHPIVNFQCVCLNKCVWHHPPGSSSVFVLTSVFDIMHLEVPVCLLKQVCLTSYTWKFQCVCLNKCV